MSTSPDKLIKESVPLSVALYSLMCVLGRGMILALLYDNKIIRAQALVLASLYLRILKFLSVISQNCHGPQASWMKMPILLTSNI